MTTAGCIDCGTVRDRCWYMVHDHVWAQTGLGYHAGYLCPPCLESRIGRPLTPDDLADLPTNWWSHGDTPRMADLKAAAKENRRTRRPRRWPPSEGDGR